MLSKFIGRHVKFHADGKTMTGRVIRFTFAGPGVRYDRMVIMSDDGDRYTRDASTVKFLTEEK